MCATEHRLPRQGHMRVFVAAWPPSPIVSQLSALARPETVRARWTRPAQWHVTLRFVGKVTDDQMGELFAALDDGVRDLDPPTARLGPSTATFGRHVLHVPVTGLSDLAVAVEHSTGAFGVRPKPDAVYNGHLTLARTRRSRGGRPRGADLRPLAGASIGASWPVEEVSVVRSHAGAEGSGYEVLHRVALGAASSA